MYRRLYPVSLFTSWVLKQGSSHIIQVSGLAWALPKRVTMHEFRVPAKASKFFETYLLNFAKKKKDLF